MSIGSQLFTILICLHVSTYHGHLQVQSVHVITNYLLLGFVLLVHLWNIGGYGFITILDAFLFFSLVFISVHGHSTDVSSLWCLHSVLQLLTDKNFSLMEDGAHLSRHILSYTNKATGWKSKLFLDNNFSVLFMSDDVSSTFMIIKSICPFCFTTSQLSSYNFPLLECHRLSVEVSFCKNLSDNTTTTYFSGCK